MILISANINNALIPLYQQNLGIVDAIEVGPYYTPEQISIFRQSLPHHPFYFHGHRIDFMPGGMRQLDRYLEVTGSPWISLHLTLVPPITYWLGRFMQIYLPAPDYQQAAIHFIDNVKLLTNGHRLPIILENLPCLPLEKYFDEITPKRIMMILEQTGCNMLLDLAHARLAAAALKMDIKEYLLKLPLVSVIQIHVSGPRFSSGQLSDTHESLQVEDYALLDWTLERTSPKIITLEYRKKPELVFEQLIKLRQMVS